MARLHLRRAAACAAALACIGVMGAKLGRCAGAAPPQPTPAQLAAQAFPGWSDGAAGRVQTVSLPANLGAGHSGYANWSAGANRVLVEPRLVLRNDATHLTLIAGLVPAGEDGKPVAAHVTPMALAAYQFEQHGGTWGISGRQGVFAFRGFFGSATPRAVTLSSQRQGVAVEYGSCWQGYCGTWLALYELDQGNVRREPAVEMALSGINIAGAADCTRRLAPLVKPATPDPASAHDDGATPGGHDCYSIDSSWAVEPAREQPGDLNIHYQGAISRAATHAAPPVAIDQRLVLRYAGGKYRAIAGFSPVPGI